MIKILIIIVIFFVVVWVFSELYKQKKINNEKGIKSKNNLSLVFIFIGILVLLLFLLPKLGTYSFGFLNKFLSPFLTILKNFIPL